MSSGNGSARIFAPCVNAGGEQERHRHRIKHGDKRQSKKPIHSLKIRGGYPLLDEARGPDQCKSSIISEIQQPAAYGPAELKARILSLIQLKCRGSGRTICRAPFAGKLLLARYRVTSHI